MRNLTVDDVLNITGQFGWSQKIYFVCFSSLQIFVAFHMLLSVFTGLEPSFVCHVVGNDIKGGHNETLVNHCVDNSPSKCTRVEYTSQYKSFATEWHLICSEKYKVALVQSLWMGGVMSGALLLGGMADRLGRLRTLMGALLGTIAFEGFSAFSPSYLIMLVLRFFGGMSCAIVILVSFVLSQELVGSEWRSFCGICLGMSFAVGIAVFSALAAVVSTWRILTFVCSVSGIVFLLLPCYLPESPRWLASEGRAEEAKEVLEGIAKLNGTLKNLPSHWEVSVTAGKGKKKTPGLSMLLSHSYVTLLTLILIFSWFVNSATYYGLTMAASDLGGDVYMSTALNGLVEVPAGIIAISIIDKLGRRVTLCGFMLVGGMACLSIQFIPQRFVMVSTGLALCGKLGISASFSACYIHSGEIFPTAIRNSGMGLVSVAARVGGMLAPFILMLGDVIPNLQFSALGLLTLMAAFLNMKLPETQGHPMPDTVADILALRTSSPKMKDKSSQNYKYNKLEDDENQSEETVVFVKDETEERDLKTAPSASSSSSSYPQRVTREDQVPLIEAEDHCPS
ncbi:hypothetical protein Pmani_022711 [Petrolisthes manimaculis]|uniref:Major facilitator superfamily (MFS) profile domain-containing protein n=1 Tax=Petrolisthes manimaculis TaxID=1843537 RepID=A0AAE1PDF6_9EUCA|nr:hypothetical protein Pmani_022711 [Petrolisthes manimaculis]